MARIIDDKTKMNIVGEKVKYYRKKKRITQLELSISLETYGIYVCRGSVSRIEEGLRTVTDIELYGISKVFNVPIQDFFDI